MRGAIRRRIADQKGYTLVELLVVMIILGTILGGVSELFVSAVQAEVDLNKRFQAQQEARLGLERLRREAHCASAVLPVGTATSSITLTLPTGCPTGTGPVTWCTQSASGSLYNLYRYPGILCSGTGTLVATALTTQNAFTFTPGISPILGRLTVNLTTDTDPSATHERYALTDSIVLRNALR